MTAPTGTTGSTPAWIASVNVLSGKDRNSASKTKPRRDIIEPFPPFIQAPRVPSYRNKPTLYSTEAPKFYITDSQGTQSHPLYTHLTISDDHSVAEKSRERHLLALNSNHDGASLTVKPRVDQDFSPVAKPAGFDPQAHSRPALTRRTPYEPPPIQVGSQPPKPAPEPRKSSNLFSLLNPGPAAEERKPVKRELNHGPTVSRSPSKPLTTLPVSQNRPKRMASFESDGSIERPIAPNAGKKPQIPTTNTTNLPSSNTIQALGITDIASLRLHELEEYINTLRSKAQLAKPIRPQILYRIVVPTSPVRERYSETVRTGFAGPYLDHPQWLEGGNVSNRIAHSTQRLGNLDLFLERNKDILFFVYRDFSYQEESTLPDPWKRETPADDRPSHMSEIVTPISDDLEHALSHLLESGEEFFSILSEFHAKKELSAPYLFIYHTRKSFHTLLEDLPKPGRTQLSIFQQ